MTRDRKVWTVALAIWLAGVAVLHVAWYSRLFVSDALETVWGLALYVVAFFYFLALWPIRDWVASHVFQDNDSQS